MEGIPREAQYPYSPYYRYWGICTAEERVHIADKNMFYYNIPDEEIIELLQTGPLAIGLSADRWSYYSSGVFYCSSRSSINHAV